MNAGDRFKSWIERVAESWKDRLGGWLLSTIGSGIDKFTSNQEPAVKESAKAALAGLLDSPVVPDEIKDKIHKASSAGNILETIYLEAIMIMQSFGVILGGSTPIANELRYAQDYLKRSSRLDVSSVITAWRRDREAYEGYFDDLREQGWSDDRIEALKFVTLFYPAPADLVRWQAREVFEPEMVSKYGLDDELGGIEREPFYKAGMTDEQITNYWRAHWEHASFNQIVEMLRRGLITVDDMWDWFRLVEIPPFWRDKLIGVTWEIPTRVDVRRFWEYGTIDEARLREIYQSQGYHGKDLDDYVLWTKIYTAFPDLMTRFKNGWLTLDNVRAELMKAGMTEAKAEELIQTKVKAAASEKLAKDKDLTMSQIVKGVKKAVITRAEGSLLLQDMGYDPYEAEFILAIEIPQDEVVTEVKLRELTKTDVLNGLKSGIISEAEALEKLLALRYIRDDAEFLLDIYKAAASPPTEAKQKEASKADIVKAVKSGLITSEDGYLMLQDIGYSPDASQFILMVNAETSPFSPMSYNEYKDLTNRWRDIVSPPGTTEPQEIRDAAAKVVELTKEVDALRSSLVEEERTLVSEEILPEEATARKKKLQASLRKAEAELSRVKTDYERLVAEWKHGLP